ncbi:MAG: hypothetical protein AAF500_02800 [Myxococcota bacterium]
MTIDDWNARLRNQQVRGDRQTAIRATNDQATGVSVRAHQRDLRYAHDEGTAMTMRGWRWKQEGRTSGTLMSLEECLQDATRKADRSLPVAVGAGRHTGYVYATRFTASEWINYRFDERNRLVPDLPGNRMIPRAFLPADQRR